MSSNFGAPIGPPTIYGLQPVVLINGVAPFITPPASPPTQIHKVPLNSTAAPGPVPSFVPATTFQTNDGSIPDP